MTRYLLVLAIGISAFWNLSTAQAQMMGEDVCCISGKVSGESGQVNAEIKSDTDCKVGSTVSGFKVCSAMRDEANICASFPKKNLCLACNFFWTGDACLAKDPAVEAKKELEAEQAKKAADAAAKKTK